MYGPTRLILNPRTNNGPGAQRYTLRVIQIFLEKYNETCISADNPIQSSFNSSFITLFRRIISFKEDITKNFHFFKHTALILNL